MWVGSGLPDDPGAAVQHSRRNLKNNATPRGLATWIPATISGAARCGAKEITVSIQNDIGARICPFAARITFGAKIVERGVDPAAVSRV